MNENFLARSSMLLLTTCVVGLASGCQEQKYYPVSGKLLDETGAPFTELAGATVSFEAEDAKVSAVAEVRPDATFTMTTETADDGCLPGEHRVAISRVFLAADKASPRYVSQKYEQFDTSGLTFTVEKSSGNNAEFKLPRLKQK